MSSIWNIDQKEVDKLFNDSVQVLRNLMNRKIEAPLSEFDQVRIKTAGTVLGNYSRLRSSQAQISMAALEIINKAAKGNQDSISEFIKTQMPFANVMPSLINQNQQNSEELQDKLNKQAGLHAAEKSEWQKEKDELKFRILQLEEKDGKA